MFNSLHSTRMTDTFKYTTYVVSQHYDSSLVFLNKLSMHRKAFDLFPSKLALVKPVFFFLNILNRTFYPAQRWMFETESSELLLRSLKPTFLSQNGEYGRLVSFKHS